MGTYFKIVNTNTRTVFGSLEEVQTYINKKKPKINTQHYRDKGYRVMEVTETIHHLSDVNTLTEETKERMINKIKTLLEGGTKLVGDFGAFLYRLNHYRFGVISDNVKTFLDTNGPHFSSVSGVEIVREYILDNIDHWVKLEFVRISTDYKPCNGLGVRVKVSPRDNEYLLIRENDILFDYFEVYGRNVNLRGIYELTDDDKF